VFFLAEQLGKTVPELLYGKSGEMSSQEFTYWQAYYQEKARIEQEANKPKKQGVADREFKRTMGGPPR
jgi:hypothetical protein